MKKLLVLVFAIALCLGVLCLGASAADGGTPEKPDGDGTAENPYQIGSAAELYWFAKTVNEGDYDAHAVLTDDITINENGTLNGTPTYTWTPIGDYINAYTGTFDGQNHTISGLYYNGSGDYAGLFGRVDSGGRVQNVNVVDSYISNSFSYGCAGGVCGWNIGTITNCSFDGTVTGSVTGTYVGGVCGYNSGMITNCSNTGSVTGTGTGYTGGLCGGNDGTITNCYNTGSVTGTGEVGGVCGFTRGTITNCYNTDSVTGTGDGTYVGGVCGQNSSGTITNCYNTGSVTGTGDGAYVGGVCGLNRLYTITNCYNTGSVTGTGDGAYVGGVCGYGYKYVTITNCYNTGSVNGSNAGGLCGGNDGTITNCYNTGTITDTGNVGAVCGKNSGTITNCYWHEDTVLTGYGINTGKVTSVEDKTTGEFASGEVAWLLNQGQENGPWRQNIVTDTSPVLNSKHGSVIKVTVLDETSTDYYGNGNHVTLPDPSPNEAYFNSSGEYIDPASYSFTDGETVYLKTAVKITVVYGNDTEDEIKYVASGGTFKLPDAPGRSGYSFVGWSDGSKTYEAGESVTVTADMTFTAMWLAINIPGTNAITVADPSNGTVKVNPANGSEGTLITVTATPDEGYELAYITVDGEKISGSTFRMPDKTVTVSALFVPVSFPFTDVKSGDWFYDAVAYVYANGLMDGTSATTFEPNANMTRAMVWAILARIDGETVTGADWASAARTWAMASGVSDGTDPNGHVTREQFATMLYRYAAAKGYDVSIGESTNILSYADFASISEYAIPAMQWACGSGIVTGVTESTLVPQGTATRAQCAAMLMRFIEGVK